jgi:hypothetical protein
LKNRISDAFSRITLYFEDFEENAISIVFCLQNQLPNATYGVHEFKDEEFTSPRVTIEEESTSRLTKPSNMSSLEEIFPDLEDDILMDYDNIEQGNLSDNHISNFDVMKNLAKRRSPNPLKGKKPIFEEQFTKLSFEGEKVIKEFSCCW